MRREQVLDYISYIVDNAGGGRPYHNNQLLINRIVPNTRLVGWQCGFEPLFVAVQSCTMDTDGNMDRVDDDEAIELATEYLSEIGWFSGEPTEADYLL